MKSTRWDWQVRRQSPETPVDKKADALARFSDWDLPEIDESGDKYHGGLPTAKQAIPKEQTTRGFLEVPENEAPTGSVTRCIFLERF